MVVKVGIITLLGFAAQSSRCRGDVRWWTQRCCYSCIFNILLKVSLLWKNHVHPLRSVREPRGSIAKHMKHGKFTKQQCWKQSFKPGGTGTSEIGFLQLSLWNRWWRFSLCCVSGIVLGGLALSLKLPSPPMGSSPEGSCQEIPSRWYLRWCFTASLKSLTMISYPPCRFGGGHLEAHSALQVCPEQMGVHWASRSGKGLWWWSSEQRAHFSNISIASWCVQYGQHGCISSLIHPWIKCSSGQPKP